MKMFICSKNWSFDISSLSWSHQPKNKNVSNNILYHQFLELLYNQLFHLFHNIDLNCCHSPLHDHIAGNYTIGWLITPGSHHTQLWTNKPSRSNELIENFHLTDISNRQSTNIKTTQCNQDDKNRRVKMHCLNLSIENPLYWKT